MSQREGFTGGFVAGAIFGSVVGGIIGSLLTARRRPAEEQVLAGTEATEESIEGARRRLEDKIAQLNLAIDDVRQRMEVPQDGENS
ncbi:MAG: hypothetical protein ACFB4I_19570 [Cyanophyceae cyanobacterium]